MGGKQRNLLLEPILVIKESDLGIFSAWLSNRLADTNLSYRVKSDCYRIKEDEHLIAEIYTRLTDNGFIQLFFYESIEPGAEHSVDEEGEHLGTVVWPATARWLHAEARNGISLFEEEESTPEQEPEPDFFEATYEVLPEPVLAFPESKKRLPGRKKIDEGQVREMQKKIEAVTAKNPTITRSKLAEELAMPDSTLYSWLQKIEKLKSKKL